MKVLFICKRRIDSYGQSFGLLNSARFVSEFLNVHDVQAEVSTVTDANEIDAVVTSFKPGVVIIEAIWVPPAKLKELLAIPRHAKRTWIVRIHSKLPFLANEGIALDWLIQYGKIGGLTISTNTPELARDLAAVLGIKAVYLPNVYQPRLYPDAKIEKNRANGVIDIGCFGAIRPLKNTLIQAVAAIRFANERGEHLRFHINGDRIEQNGVQVVKNLDALFAASTHELVKHPWMNHEEFIRAIRTMDMGLQVSLSESFNIVVADFVSNGIPTVVSADVSWMPTILTANPNSSESIVAAMHTAWGIGRSVIKVVNRAYLNWHNRSATKLWLGAMRAA